MLHVNLVVGAYGLDDDAGLFHGWQYAKQFKLGHCKNQISPLKAPLGGFLGARKNGPSARWS
jgi:hypothetical protein